MARTKMLNPLSWRDLVSRYKGDMKRASKEWKRMKKSPNPVKQRRGGKKVAKRRATGAGTVTSTTLDGRRITFKTPMPRQWVERWREGYKRFLQSQPMAMPPEWWSRWKAGLRRVTQPMEMPPSWKEAWREGVERYAAQPMAMPPEWWSRWKAGLRRVTQPMEMPPEWKAAWARGTLARGPVSPLSKQYARKWRAGVRAYASQPLALAETLGELASVETLMSGLAIAGGITAPTLGQMLYEKVFKPAAPLGVLGTTAIGLGSGVAGFVLLNMAGRPSEARLFFGGTLGGILANLIARRFLGGGAAGLGQVDSLRKQVEEAVSETLREEGLGQLTQEELEEISGLGQLTETDVEELEGVGAYGLE